ncbi:MAG: transglutaminase-like domain-containing protein [Clostridia bacterium]|nr:transglutaminase-like domain-containing protein [Clostridia bacterium]
MKYINDMAPLAVDLPEDILRAKWCGDFARCQRLIDIYLENEKIPECTKERLRIEKRIIYALPRDFEYPYETALKMAEEAISGMTREEFDSLIDHGKIEWIYVNGVIHCHTRFLDTLTKVNPDMAERAGLPPAAEDPAKIVLKQNVIDFKATGKATWHIHMKAWFKIDDDAFRPGETVKVHLPLPKNAINMKNINIIATSHQPAVIGDADDAQRTVYIETALEQNEQFWVEYEYDSTVKYINLMDEKNIELAGKTSQAKFDTEELYPHIRFTPFIRQLCAELKGDEKNPIKVARKFYDYCTTKVTYSYMREYFTIREIPDYCGLGLKGDCGVQALLFITLCRCAGIPAKWQSGLYVNPHYVGPHDWAMFHVEPFGWLFADCSFGGSAFRAGEYDRHELYFGNLDPFRMAANSEYQADLVPEKKQLRIDPYDNQRGEAEYEDAGITSFDMEYGYELISMEKTV